MPSANRGTILKNDKDLYYLNTEGDVCHYDLHQIVDDLRFKQETWSYKNVQKAKKRIPANAKEIADAYHDDFYTVTCTGSVVHYPDMKGTRGFPRNQNIREVQRLANLLH